MENPGKSNDVHISYFTLCRTLRLESRKTDSPYRVSHCRHVAKKRVSGLAQCAQWLFRLPANATNYGGEWCNVKRYDSSDLRLAFDAMSVGYKYHVYSVPFSYPHCYTSFD